MKTFLRWLGPLLLGFSGAAVFNLLGMWESPSAPDRWQWATHEVAGPEADVPRQGPSRALVGPLAKSGLARRTVSEERLTERDVSGDAEPALREDDPHEAEAEEAAMKIVEPYEEEPRTPLWASRTERALRWGFSEFSSSAANTEIGEESPPFLESLECRSSRCRILLHHSDRQAADRVQEELIRGEVFDVPGCRLRSTGYEEHEAGIRQTLYAVCEQS